MYMVVPMRNRNGKIIKKQRVYLTPNSPYKPRAMNEIFPPRKRARPLTPPKRKSPPKKRNSPPKKRNSPPKSTSPFKMPAFPGWPA
jgi:hypothetical protein